MSITLSNGLAHTFATLIFKVADVVRAIKQTSGFGLAEFTGTKVSVLKLYHRHALFTLLITFVTDLFVD